MVIPINTPTIDSLNLMIDKSKIQILDKALISKVMTYFVDLNCLDDTEEPRPPKPYIHEKDGVTIRLQWVHYIDRDNKQVERLSVTLSSKLLYHRYFQGIRLYNVKYLYLELMDLKVFKCSYEDFLNASVSDVDICINYRICEDSFLTLQKLLIKSCRVGYAKFFNLFEVKTPREKQEKHNKKWDKWHYKHINLGLDINTRHKAKPSTPYLKNYFKEIELQTKSKVFYEKYLKKHIEEHQDTIKDLARVEYTIKGYKQKERLIKHGYLSENYNTLKELLNINFNSFKDIIRSGFNDYIINPERKDFEIETKDITPMEALVCDLMTQVVLNGGSYADLSNVLDNYTGMTKSRLKSKIEKLIRHVKTNNLSFQNQLKANNEIKGFFDDFIS